jgi:hypothetical protein
MCLSRLPIGSHLPDENVTLTELALNNSPSGHSSMGRSSGRPLEFLHFQNQGGRQRTLGTIV